MDRLELETLVSTSGLARHRATVRARVAADGFFDFRLPDSASLWSLTLNGEPIKPVGRAGVPGTVRVELPGGREPANASTVVVVYETPGQPWTTAAWRSVAAPTFDAGVPVLQSRWTLRLPDGFDYHFPDFDQQNAEADELLVTRFAKTVGRVFSSTLQPGSLPAPATSRGVETEADEPPVAGRLRGTDSPAMDVDLDAQSALVPRQGRENQLGAKRDQPRLRGEGGIATMNRKLQRIIIPHIEFRSTTLADAVDFLRQESVRLDTVESDPEARGVNIFLNLPAYPAVYALTPPDDQPIPGLPPGANFGAAAAVPVVTASTRISLNLSRIPLLEALRYVASQAGLKVKVEQYAVSLAPLNEVTDVLITREFRVSPSFFSHNTAAPNAPRPNISAEDFLKASGVQFPAGASATYLRSSSKLVVRNTQENIDLIETLVQEAEPPPPKEGAESRPRIRKIEESTADINRKLQRIIIPHVEFRATTFADAVEFLRQESVRLDHGPEPHGVSIFSEIAERKRCARHHANQSFPGKHPVARSTALCRSTGELQSKSRTLRRFTRPIG